MTRERQIVMLTQMGIDVWVRRGSERVEATLESAAPDTPRRVRPIEPPQVPDTPQFPDLPRSFDSPTRIETAAGGREMRSAGVAAPLPVIAPEAPATRSWTALAAGTVVLVGDFTLPQDRRFAQDVLLAAAGYPQETVAAVTFEEPGSVAGGQPSNAVLAFIRGQIDRRRATLLLVCGRAASGFTAATGTAAEEPRWTRLHGVRCLWLPDLDQVRVRPDWKRSLWRALIQPP